MKLEKVTYWISVDHSLLTKKNLDFETGLTIEPNNKSLLDELKKLPAAKQIEKSKLKKVMI